MNIHQYPENQDDLPAYRIAVMQAALAGKPVQSCNPYLDDDEWHDYHAGHSPMWDWSMTRYRIRPEPAYKPWNAETFRWPDCLRRRDVGNGPGLPFVVLSVCETHLNTADTIYSNFGGYCYTWQGLLDNCEASYDRGATWQRCGEGVKP